MVHCPHDGRCLNTTARCRAGASSFPAIAVAFDCGAQLNVNQISPRTHEPYLQRLARTSKASGASALFMVPRPALQPVRLPPATTKTLQQWGWTLVETAWVTPPRLHPTVAMLAEGTGCCGAREFHKLHALGIDAPIDSVVLLDTDIDILGDDDNDRVGVGVGGGSWGHRGDSDAMSATNTLRTLFDCAASGFVLSTRGVRSPANGGLWAFPPSASLLSRLLLELSHAQPQAVDGWNASGWGALGASDGRGPQPYYGAFSFQGFAYWAFYQSSLLRHGAFRTRSSSSAAVTTAIRAAQLDPCVWNLQVSSVVASTLCAHRNAREVRVHHAAQGKGIERSHRARHPTTPNSK